jgi:hypothetical protein
MFRILKELFASSILKRAGDFLVGLQMPMHCWSAAGWALECWNLPEGSAMRIASALADYTMTRASSNSPVVVAERWGYHVWNPFREVPDYLSLIVMDLRSGRRLASLKPGMQHGNYASRTNIRNWYFQYALSPDGDLLAEGGDGELRLFQLQ